MILEDSTILFAVLLSIIFLKVRYSCKPHGIALAFCIAGMTIAIINDLVIKP